MSFKSKVLMCSTLILVLFVMILMYASMKVMKITSDNQLLEIQKEITDYNNKLLFSFIQVQDKNLNKEVDLISEKVKYIAYSFSHKIGNKTKDKNKIKKVLGFFYNKNNEYIKALDYIDLSNDEIYLVNKKEIKIKDFFLKEYDLIRYKNMYIEKNNVGNVIEHVYLYLYLDDSEDSLLRVELNLDYFSSLLNIDDLDFRYLLVDNYGLLISSNLNERSGILYDYFSEGGEHDNETTQRIITQFSGNFTLHYKDEVLNITFLTNKKTGWKIILVTPESFVKSNYITTKNLLSIGESKLIKYFLILTIILLMLFLFINSLVVNRLILPFNKLIKQAKSLQGQNYRSAITIIKSNGDEIEQLSIAYSDAGRTIKALIEELEDKVEARTKQYESASKSASNANKQKSILLSNVSHEIRTPLNAIIGYTNILNNNNNNNNNNNYLKNILTSSHMILSIVNDLLDFERVKGDNYTLKPKNISLDILIDEVNASFIPFSNESGVVFNVKKKGFNHNSYLFIDELRFKQALSNIITNAFKFTKSGSVELFIELRGGEVIFNIIDTGIGIPEDKLSLIFNSFEQVNNDDKLGGFGLGLAITKTIVTLMKGTILVESELGKGSKFIITLPSSLISYENKKECTSVMKKINVNTGFEYLTALLVDDVDFNLEILEYQLNLLGIKCIKSKSGKEAVNIFKNIDVDIVFTDISMPEMNGIELSLMLKEINMTIPIVAVTARATLQEESKMNNNFKCYITKPINNNDIVTSLNCSLYNGSC